MKFIFPNSIVFSFILQTKILLCATIYFIYNFAFPFLVLSSG